MRWNIICNQYWFNKSLWLKLTLARLTNLALVALVWLKLTSTANKENVDFEGSLRLQKAVYSGMQEGSFWKDTFTRGMAVGWHSESLPNNSYTQRCGWGSISPSSQGSDTPDYGYLCPWCYSLCGQKPSLEKAPQLPIYRRLLM